MVAAVAATNRLLGTIGLPEGVLRQLRYNAERRLNRRARLLMRAASGQSADVHEQSAAATPAYAPRPPGGGERLHHARNRRRGRAAGDALFDRQGLRRDAAPGRKAFFPAPPPFPLLHVDTTWKFRDMYALRDKVAAEAGHGADRLHEPGGRAQGINPFDHGPLHTDMWKTEGLKQALDKYGFDVVFGGARRDEEKSRAKERIFSFRDRNHRWDPSAAARAVAPYNARKSKGETIRVFPLSNWTELDIWQYICAEKIPIVPLYFAAERPRSSATARSSWSMTSACPWSRRRSRCCDGAVPHARLLSALGRDRERGRDARRRSSRKCWLPTTSERQGRVIDRDAGSERMEKKKQEGYF